MVFLRSKIDSKSKKLMVTVAQSLSVHFRGNGWWMFIRNKSLLKQSHGQTCACFTFIHLFLKSNCICTLKNHFFCSWRTVREHCTLLQCSSHIYMKPIITPHYFGDHYVKSMAIAIQSCETAHFPKFHFNAWHS